MSNMDTSVINLNKLAPKVIRIFINSNNDGAGSLSTAAINIPKEQNDASNERLSEIDGLLKTLNEEQSNADGRIVPVSALKTALNNMVTQWNSLLSHVVTEVDHPQEIKEHIKETAEFSVKQFRDACLEMNSELTRVSIDWQLKSPAEMSDQQIAEYEKSIGKQELLLAKMRQKLDEEVAENPNF